MKEMSSATVIFACMKSCTVSGAHFVDGLPAKPAFSRKRRSAGIFQLAVPVQPPLVEDAVDLRVVDNAGHVHLPVGADLGERAEDRTGAEHRRGDPDAPPRLADPLRDPVGQRLTVLRA